MCLALAPAGCAAAAGGGPGPWSAAETAPDPGPAAPVGLIAKTAVDRSSSALAYEHYLKARLAMGQNHLREATGELRTAITYDGGSVYLHTELGRLYARQGLWRLAAESAREAVALDPLSVNGLLLQGDCLVQAAKIDEAIPLYERGLAIDRHRIDAYERLATIYLDRKDGERALHILREMTDANPESAAGFRRLGDILFERGDEKGAEANFRRVLQIEPSDTDTIRTLTGLLEQQGRYREALQVFDEALETSPENPFFMAYMARLYLKDGDAASAEAYLDQLRAGDPSNASLIARAYAEINRHGEAIAELERVLVRAPGEHGERLLLAVLYEERKQWEQALTHLRQIPKGDRTSISARTNIAYCLQSLGKLDEAEAVLDELSREELEPDDRVRVYRILGQVWAKSKRTAAGLTRLDEAIRANPDLAELIEIKAELLFEAGRGEDGVRLLQQQLERKPGDPSLLYALGSLYERLGRIPASLKTMRSLIELEPNNSAALNFVGYTLADQDTDLDEAERLVRRALLLNPGNGAITDSLGWVLYKKGDFAGALEMLQRADQTSPGEPVIIMHVGDALLKLGRRAEAIVYYRRSLERNPEGREREELLRRFKQLGLKP